MVSPWESPGRLSGLIDLVSNADDLISPWASSGHLSGPVDVGFEDGVSFFLWPGRGPVDFVGVVFDLFLPILLGLAS